MPKRPQGQKRPADAIGKVTQIAPGRLAARMRASIGRPLPKRVKNLHLGFANDYEEQLFRALAAVHPKGVRISDAGSRLYADEHVKRGLFNCAIDGARTYRLTHQGVRRAVDERLMKERA